MISCQIAQLRRCVGLSQSQLAQQLHITPSALGMYEQGRRTPSLEILIQLSRIFNVSLDYLITGSEFSSSFDNNDRNHLLFQCPFSNCRCQRITPNCCQTCHLPCHPLHNSI